MFATGAFVQAEVVINEFVSSNGTILADEDGDFEDWIELYNTSTTETDLTDWGLSDSNANPFKWRFPAGTVIPPGGHLLVWASGKERLPSDELPGVLREVWDGISGTTLADLINHESFPDRPSSINRLADFLEAPQNIGDNYGQRLSGYLVPPQSGNYRFWIASDDDSELRLSSDQNPANAVVIASVSTWTDPRQWDKFPSQRSARIPLVAGQRYYFEALMKEGAGDDHLAIRWQLPDATVEEPIPAHNFVSETPGGRLHTNFRISSSGETLTLTRPDGTMADQVPPVFVPRDVSYGRLTDGAPTWHYFAEPTPATANTSPPFTLPPEVIVSEPRGFRNAPFSVTLSSVEPETIIRYTLDGSTPGPDSPVYDSPLSITGTTTLRASAVGPGMIPLPPTTTTWLFVDDVLQQGSIPLPGWPKDREINNHRMEYGLRSEIVAGDNARLREGLGSIPSISLVTDLDNLFDSNTGIYSYSSTSHGEERPVSVELIDPAGDLNAEFQIDAGLRLRGAFSRSLDNPKHSLRLLFRSAYGEDQLHFPLFGDEGASSFEKIDLRTEQNYSWAFQNDSRNTFIREVFSRDTQRDMGLPHTRSRYYHLYLNGQYWGLYMTQERGEADWAATYLGGQSDDWDTIKTSQPGYFTDASDGNFAAFHTLHDIAVNQGFAGSHADNYWRVRGLNPDGSPNPDYPVYVDQDNVIAYMLVTHYTGDRDAPVSLFANPNRPNNMYGLFNRRNPDGFKWLRHDAEHSLGVRPDEGVFWDPTFLGENITEQGFFNPATLNWRLLEHPEYRMRFADLAQRHLFQNGALTPENAKARVQSRMAEIDTAIVAESARWGRGRTRDSHWLPACQTVLSYLDERRDILIEHYRNRGWFPTIDAPSVAVTEAGLHISFTTPLYYMTDGTDPRLPGGGIHPDAIFVETTTSLSPVELVPRSATWRYYDSGSAPPVADGRAWTDPDYQDQGWSSGPAILGFAGIEPQNPVATQTKRWISGNSGPQVTTTYFRHEFTLDEEADFSRLLLEILRDDGAVVYLNGTEILRENMPGGTVDYDTLATGAVGGSQQTTWFQRTPEIAHLLQAGTNLLAVSIHQNWGESSDKYFGLSLTGLPVEEAVVLPLSAGPHLRIRSYQDGEWSALSDGSTLAGLPEPSGIHSWNFNNAATFTQPSFSSGPADLTTAPGSATEFVHNGPDEGNGLPTGHLRVNNPPGATLTFHLPTTGYDNITVSYETRRSNQGATQQVISYSLDGEDYTFWAAIDVAADVQTQTFDFAAIPGADDNGEFRFRITIEQGEGGPAGNNRFDNFVISGFPLPGVNRPPEVDDSALPVGPLVAGSPMAADLGDIFTDPDGDALTFAVNVSSSAVATADLTGQTLTITPHAPGEATFTLSADDGQNEPTTTFFTVLVYPAPRDLRAGVFTFGEWNASAPAMTFPEHMIFLQSERDDPDLTTPLDRAYQIPATDAAAQDDGAFPYNAASRTRINGLGADGIAFINTGRGRDVGGALLALETSGLDAATVTFDAGTVRANSRIYALRLQYRVGISGDFLDVPDALGQPVEYLRAADGDRVTLGPVVLPDEALGEPYVQLLWRYHLVSGTSGARAQLLLDNVSVAAAGPGAASALVLETTQPPWVQADVSLAAVTVRAVNDDGLTDANFNGLVTLSLIGEGTLGGTLTVSAIEGVAVFTDLTVTGNVGQFSLRATSDELAIAESANFSLTDVPVFLPGGDADWTEAASWTSATYPEGPGARARILSSTTGNRNINLRAPVSIGHLEIGQSDSSVRQRLRDRSTDNLLTFDGGESAATLHIKGTGQGFVELENVAGTILATDLELAVHNTAGDPEHGALRLRESWNGPGGLVKTGPGMASLTGEGKLFTGTLRILHGVLQVTEPATPTFVAEVVVAAGGQLRLSSGSNEAAPVRFYDFGGSLRLAGQGRSGVPDGEGLGVFGALRYEPGSNGNAATVATAVHLDERATVHVAGENLLTLASTLSGEHDLTKTGGGTLELTGTQTTPAPPVNVQNGTLSVAGIHPAMITLAAEATLTGSGQTGTISGPGTVRTGAQQLVAHSSSAARINAVLRTTNGPEGNGLLALTDTANPLPAAPQTIDLFVDPDSALRPGDRLAGGLSTPTGHDLPTALTSTTVNLLVADPAGAIEHLGQNYRPASEADGLTWGIRSAADGPILEVLRTGTPSSYTEWRNLHFSDPAERTNDTVSGPNAQRPSQPANLLRYALDLDEPGGHGLPLLDTGTRMFRFALDAIKSDLVWIVEASPDLADWSDTLFDSRESLPPEADADGLINIPYPAGQQQYFLRLKLLLTPLP